MNITKADVEAYVLGAIGNKNIRSAIEDARLMDPQVHITEEKPTTSKSSQLIDTINEMIWDGEV